MDTKDLESKIDELIVLIDELEQKQGSMTADQDAWQDERIRLLDKNELAKTKVEAMIQRLKTLDQDQ
ncbi:MAG: cell division protein ZapB [Candidatus Azotimanducaceae bacterium]|jgi:cell division protein ZapB